MPNGDLWQEDYAHLDRFDHLEVFKVKAHESGITALEGTANLQDWLGNLLADAAAGACAEMLRPSPEDSAWATQWANRGFGDPAPPRRHRSVLG